MSTHVDAKQAKLNELFELGKRKGSLTYDEIINKLAACEIDPEQFDNVLETLEAMGIAVTRGDEEPKSAAQPEPMPDDLDLSIPRNTIWMIRCACISRRSAGFRF